MHKLLRITACLLRYLAGIANLITARLILLQPGCQSEGVVKIARGVRLRITDGGSAKLADGVTLDRFTDVKVKHGKLEIGANTYIGQNSVICVLEAISIGVDCLIAEHVTIRDQDHRFGPGKITAKSGFTVAPVIIGDNVWIGAKCTITKGVTIGSNAVIGANSVVTRDVLPHSVVVGIPARTIHRNSDNK